MKNFLLIIPLILFSTCCIKNTTNSTLITEAEHYRKAVTREADKWLTNFNVQGYAKLLNHKFPPPFAKIILDSLKRNLHLSPTNNDNVIDSVIRNEFQQWINKIEHEYGVVKKRTFIGLHIITRGKLLNYNPAINKGFEEIDPKKLGVKSINQLYLKNVEGTYAYLMYDAQPTLKEKAQELLVFYLGSNNKWMFLIYKISDNI